MVIIELLFLLTVISNADKAIIEFASVPIIEELNFPRQTNGNGRECNLSFVFACSRIRWSNYRSIWYKNCYCRYGNAMVAFSIFNYFCIRFAILLITRIILGAGEGPSYSLAMTAASKWLP